MSGCCSGEKYCRLQPPACTAWQCCLQCTVCTGPQSLSSLQPDMSAELLYHGHTQPSLHTALEEAGEGGGASSLVWVVLFSILMSVSVARWALGNQSAVIQLLQKCLQHKVYKYFLLDSVDTRLSLGLFHIPLRAPVAPSFPKFFIYFSFELGLFCL